MAASGCGGIVLQFEVVLVILRDPGVASSGGERSLHRNGRSEVRGDLAVADAAPLEMGFVDQVGVDDDVSLTWIAFSCLLIERLLGKVELARTVRGGDGANVGVADGEGIVFAQLKVDARIDQERGWVGQGFIDGGLGVFRIDGIDDGLVLAIKVEEAEEV